MNKAKRVLLLGVLAATLAVVSGCGTQQATQEVTLEGKLVNLCGQPLPYKTVYVPGHDPVLTGADGTFTIEEVATPYDLVISNAYLLSDRVEELPILIYQGMTEDAPIVAVNVRGESDDGCSDVHVFGNLTTDVTGGDRYGFDANSDLEDYSAYGDWDEENGASYSTTLSVAPDGAVSLKSLLWEVDDDGEIAGFLAGAHDSFVPGSDEVEKNMTLSPVGTDSLTATVSIPVAENLESLTSAAVVSGETGLINLQRFNAEDAVDGEYTFLVPDGDGWGVMLAANGRYGNGYLSVGESDISSISGWTVAWLKVLAASEEAVSLDLPSPVVPVSPVSGTVINKDAVFSWVGPEGAMYDVLMRTGQDGPDISIEIVTKQTAVGLPDLGELGVSYKLARNLYWSIVAWGSDGLPDDADGVASLEGARALWLIEDGYFGGESGYGVYVDAGEFGMTGFIGLDGL